MARGEGTSSKASVIDSLDKFSVGSLWSLDSLRRGRGWTRSKLEASGPALASLIRKAAKDRTRQALIERRSISHVSV